MKAEIKGRGKQWKVLYPDEAGITNPVAVFGNDGVLKKTILVGAPTAGQTESHFVGTKDEAIEHAYALGATEITITRTKPRGANLKGGKA